MILKEKMLRRLKLNRPSLRARARPPKQRTHLGMQFTAANLSTPLAMQTCTSCGFVQYPPAELCGECLGDTLVYRDAHTEGELIAKTALHHSMWEFFKRRLKQDKWAICTVKLADGPIAFCHLVDRDLQPGDAVKVFSHTDCSRSMVLIAVSASTGIVNREDRAAIVAALGLDQPALREGGI